ncbi:MAG: helix-turn-helix transcriptional regulator [Clostridia bacterium]|nr:helix-turn-helix transcriptional regulator [Clostridia bacterium]
MKQNLTDLGLIAGENLKRLIKQSDCKTQAEFAYRFGTSPRNVSRWINEGIESLSIIQQIASFFGVDALTLLSL